MRNERKMRSIAKAISWQVMGLLTTTAIAYGLTGSVTQAGGFAFLSAAIGFVCYFLHERLWMLISWGSGELH
ncbi:DUF2061 domain-containing protein [Aestuariispira ectoiniformans]|uniref:DUF2061 domain-containing protein n=1 Tax=Aestuariispira ectoiniformans TaxID=2775080 RepID=UPI00223B92DA|nr:DUF2061 domain-containing protein [Aestuariispira ectoiniformans]